MKTLIRVVLGLHAIGSLVAALAFGAVYVGILARSPATAALNDDPEAWRYGVAAAACLVVGAWLWGFQRWLGRTDPVTQPGPGAPAPPVPAVVAFTPPPLSASTPRELRCERCGTEKRLVMDFRRRSWLLSVAGLALAMAAFGPLQHLPYAIGLELAAFLLILSPIALALRRRCFRCEPLTWPRS